MKPMDKTMYWVIGIVFILTSCVKHDSIFRTKEPENTKDLEVPEGFDWSDTQAVTLSVTSPSATVASFYFDKRCTPDSRIGVLPVPEGKTTFHFDLPYSQKSIFVQYPVADGKTRTIESSINNGVISKSSVAESDDIIFTEPFLSHGFFSLNIPYTGKYGTIMFEDTWPDTEDYDFNDVVVNYKINCEMDTRETSAHDIQITVSLKIRALGGQYPYDFAMQIGTWTSGAIPFRIPADDVRGLTNVKTANSNIGVEILKTEHPAVVITGLNSLRRSNFYNTVNKEDEGVQIDFTINIKGTLEQQFQRLSGLADPKAFDYFLRHENGREIHMMGYAPTSLYQNYESEVGKKGGRYYYQNSKGLVWGLKVPVEIGWPAERKDIIRVYTRFAEWVQSGGKVLGANGVDPLKWYEFHTKDNYIY